jgi:peptidoglycan/LPS O-acetylase OafA/YrhL
MGGGVIGVDIFFVLSGFLITALLLEEESRAGRIDFVAFYRRRALRLFPALALLLPVVAIAANVSPEIDKTTAGLTTGAIPWVVGYVANWGRAIGTQMGLFGHTWSLAIEEQFYLLWPVVLLALLGKNRRYGRVIIVSLAVVLVVAVYRAVLWSAGAGVDRVANGTDMRADSLLVGCAIAAGLQRGLSLRPPPVVVALALGFLGFVIATQGPFAGFLYVGGLTFVALAAGVVILAALESPWLLNYRPLVLTGKISYGIYLWHFPIVFLVPLSWPVFVRAPLVIALTLLVAASSWYLVEERFLRLKRQGTMPRRATAASVGDRAV